MGKYNDLFVTLLERGLIDRKTCCKYFSQNFKKYTIEDFNSFKKDENGRIICPSGDYTEIKNFPDFCKFEKECFFAWETVFGKSCCFGANCLFGACCKFGNSNIFHEACIFDQGCIFGKYCLFYKKSVFGSYSKLGDGCVVKEECRFGRDSSFGRGIIFGHNCKFGLNGFFDKYCIWGKNCLFNWTPYQKLNKSQREKQMNKKLQSAFNVVVKYGFCGECRYNLDSIYCEGTMCYKDVNLIRDALEVFSEMEEEK